MKESVSKESRPSIGLNLYNGMEAREIERLSEKAEKEGFGSVWISEDPYLRDIVPLVSLMAKSTTNARIGTSILNIYTKHPVYLAMAAATLDEISNGRLTLGIGRGVRSLIENELHIKYGSYHSYAEEYLICLRKLLNGEEVTYEGKQIKITRAKLRAFPKDHTIRTLLAAIGPKMLQLGGSLADGVILNSCSSVEHAKLAAGIVGTAWEKEDLRPEIAVCLTIAIDEDLSKAYKSARTSVAFILSIPGFGETYSKINNLPNSLIEELRRAFRWDSNVGDPTWHLENADLSKVEELVTDKIVDMLAVCGSVEKCRSRISDYMRAGTTTAILNPANSETLGKLPLLI